MVSFNCFGVRMFHFMFVHYTFSSVATIWEIAARSVRNLFSLYFAYCNTYLFPVLVLRAENLLLSMPKQRCRSATR